MTTISRRVLVSGRVQGVWFRQTTADTARRAGVTGWVRNLADGRVEALLEGDPDAVAAVIAWCHEGPPAARVDRVAVSPAEREGASDFEVRP